MAINVQWDDERHRTIRLTYHRPWTWEEFQAAFVQVDEMFTSTPETVDLIIDIRDGGFPPPDALARFRHVLQNQHPNRGIIAFIGIPFIVMSFVKLIRRVSRGNEDIPVFQFFPSLEAARQAIVFHRNTHV